MNLVYTQQIKDYMAAKGYVGIAFEQLSSIGCCADSVELYSRFVKGPEAEKLRAQGTWRIVEAPVGELFLARGIECAEDVTVSLKSFLGLKDIKADGIYPWRL